jgi:hypothetical protein
MSVDPQKAAVSRRVGAWMGIVFVVLFVAGFLTVPTPDDSSDSDKWARWWTDSGHRVAAVIGTYLIVLALLAFVWFMWSLRDRLRSASGMMVTFGSLFVGLTLTSALVRATIPGAKLFGDSPIPADADLARQLDNLGFGLWLVAGALCAGAFTAIASWLAHRDGVLPRWLVIAGYVVAVLQLAAGIFIPFVLFVLWVLVVSIVLLRRGGTSAQVAAAAP